jgi:CDP-ribitol ribitolphosphotransferase / teichoic acid ribitol-phosphate polymerase
MDHRTREPAIEVVLIRWERIQLLLDVRPAAGTGLDPAGLRLRQVGGSGTLPPTHVSVEGDLVRIRINVMQGPDLQPLEPGRWQLLVRGGRGARAMPLRLVDASAVASDRDAAAFRLRDGVLRARPVVAADGSLAIDVEFEAGIGFARDAGRRARAGQRLRGWLGSVRGAAFRLALHGIKAVVGRSGRRILFTSDSRAGLGGNLQDVHDRMVERGLDREYRLDTLFKDGLAGRRGMVDRLRLPWLLAAADVIVIDDFHPIIYRVGVDPRVRIIQLWHASGAFKTVGYSRVGKPGGPDPYGRGHKNYTHAIVSSEFDVPFYAEAFGIPEARVVPTGIPRMDRFFDEAARTAGLEAARAAFPETVGRMTILFAPTFRGDGPRTATYDIAGLDYAALHTLCVEKDAVIIIRMHPFVTEPLAIPEAFRDRVLDGSVIPLDVNDLLFAVDLVVTDYSSIVFEFSTLGRPMLFFAYDLEDYIATRDFYVPFESFVPGRIVRTFPEMLDAIRRDDYEVEKVAAFAARHFAHLDGGSTDRVIDDVILAR